MKKFFITNIVIMVFANLLVKPIWVFGIDRNVQLAVGTDYGLYNALLNFSIIFSILLDMGLTNYNNRKVAAHPSDIDTLMPTILSAKIGLFILYILLLLLTALLFGQDAHALHLLFLLGIAQFLNSLLQYLRSNIAAHHHFKTDSLLSVFDKVLMIIVCAFILLNPVLKSQFTIFSFVYLQIICNAIAVIVAFVFCKKYLQKLRFNFIHSEIKDTLQKSIPMAILILLMGVYMRIDSVLVERLLPNGKMQNDLYARAGKLLDASNMIGFLFAGMLLPMFSKLLAKQKSISEIVWTSTNLLLPISIIVSVFSWFYRAEIIELLFHNSSQNVPLAFGLLMFCFPAYCIMNIFSTLLTANNNLKTLTAIALLCGVVNIVANCILLPKYGYLAAAFVAVGTHFLAAILYIYSCTKNIFLQIPKNVLLKILAFLFIYIVLNAIVTYFHFTIFVALIINIIGWLPLLFGLGLFNAKALLQYLPKQNQP